VGLAEAGASLEITIDAEDPERVAAFWTAALGYRHLYRRDPYVVCGPPPGVVGPRVVIQSVPGSPAPASRVHLDLRVPAPDATVARLVALGATVEAEVEEGTRTWTVLRAPEGVAVCVCPARG
jgi:predicted enzyme related to lactoylglutathione lyase